MCAATAGRTAAERLGDRARRDREWHRPPAPSATHVRSSATAKRFRASHSRA
jgi:hypothetical protein